MKQMMKFAAAAAVAGLFTIGLAAPSQAAPSRYMAPAASYHTTAANGYNDYDRAGSYGAPGYGAYDYAPGQASQGSFGGNRCMLSPSSLNYVPCLNH